MKINETHNIDCIEGMKQMAPDSVDVIVTSPPYNVGTKYGKHNDKMTEGLYISWLNEVFSQCHRILKCDGSFFLNIGGRPKNQNLPLRVALQASQTFELQNTISWVKSISIPQEENDYKIDIAMGHYRPINRDKYLNTCHEFVFHYTKHGSVPIDKLANGVPYKGKSNISRWQTNDLRDRGNVWFVPYETTNESKGHPCPFPSRLAEMCIKLHRQPTLVMDPFMGIGSTAVAAKRLGINFIGFEIDPIYAKIANEKV